MSRLSLGLVLVFGLSSHACGRVNYDPVALSGDQDASGSAIDASANIDGGPGCSAAAVTGSYIGDGSDGRIINTGVQPSLVILQSEAGQETVIRMATMANDSSKSLVGSQTMAPGMISNADNGFAVAPDSRVNGPGQTYHWLALPLAIGIWRGEYDGNGTSQSITGLGFRPEWVLFADEGDGSAVVHMPQPANLTFRLDNGTGVTDGVSSLDADGFTLGGRPFVNASGRHFHYVAWRSAPGSIATGNYVGDGDPNRQVSGLALTPSYVMTHRLNSVVMQRFASLPTGVALPVIAQTPIADTIKGFSANAFSLGAANEVNELGSDYTFTAFATCP